MGNLLCAGSFKWKIEGFSSLLKLGDISHSSKEFNAGGYRWRLVLYPKQHYNNKEYVSLYLLLEDACSLKSDQVIRAIFTFHVYDQLHGNHRKSEADFHFQNTYSCYGSSRIISLEEFKNASAGFLVNDSCIFSVHILCVGAYKLKGNGLSECLTMQKELMPQSYTWKIENFSELERPSTSCGNFIACGHKWKLILYPDGFKKNGNCLSLFLELVTTSALELKSELYVEYMLCMMDQTNGNHKKYTGKRRFDSSTSTHGLEKFLTLEEFQDPLKGFLVENACIIKATITILGLVSLP